MSSRNRNPHSAEFKGKAALEARPMITPWSSWESDLTFSLP
jgi:hypothetical protein